MVTHPVVVAHARRKSPAHPQVAHPSIKDGDSLQVDPIAFRRFVMAKTGENVDPSSLSLDVTVDGGAVQC